MNRAKWKAGALEVFYERDQFADGYKASRRETDYEEATKVGEAKRCTTVNLCERWTGCLYVLLKAFIKRAVGENLIESTVDSCSQDEILTCTEGVLLNINLQQSMNRWKHSWWENISQT